MTIAMALGSVAGALAAGERGRISPRILVASAGAFGVCELLAAAAPSLLLQVIALVPLGAVSVTFAAGVNSSMQLAASPVMRGRVMSLYSIVFLGSTPIGAPLVGWLAEISSPRAGLALGGVAALVAAVGARAAFARFGDERTPATALARGGRGAPRSDRGGGHRRDRAVDGVVS
jgi:MFS family permease